MLRVGFHTLYNSPPLNNNGVIIIRRRGGGGQLPPICSSYGIGKKPLSSLPQSQSQLHFSPPPAPTTTPFGPLIQLNARHPPPLAQSRPSAYDTDVDDPVEANKRLQVSKRIERTANYFRRLGMVGFWSQLVCSVVSAVILAFSVAITGKATAEATFYLTAGGMVAGFLSVFWSFGYIRLSERLRNTVSDLSKVPPRAEVARNLKNGVMINLVGMASTILGMQATVGLLVAKALTSSPSPYMMQGSFSSISPVLALDVFLVQASANTLLSHFLGIVFSLELLRSVTLAQPPPDNVIPKPVQWKG